MPMRSRPWFPALLCLCLLAACSPDVDVYAPERELFVVYGVLDPDKPVQYVTITKVYQTKGDAYAYASQNDLTARGMQVRMRSGTQVLQAALVQIVDTIPDMFSPTTAAYRFETTGPNALVPGRRYDLEITKPGDSAWMISAYTEIPTQPVLTSPGPPIYSAQLETYTYPTIDFSEDQDIYFDRGSGRGFELRVYVEYQDGENRHVARWGPTPVFKRPVRCNANVGVGEGCYEIPNLSVPNVFHSVFAQYPDTVYVYDTIRVARTLDSLNRTAWIEVTSVDSFLTSYLTANTAFGFGLNLLMDKKEYSNISGGNVGIFGAIHTSSNYVFLGSCTRWLMGLRGRRPAGCGG